MAPALSLAPDAKAKLARIVAVKPDVFSLIDEPALGSLLSVLAVQSELGTALDRLSAALGFLGASEASWSTRVLRSETDGYGLSLARADHEVFRPESAAVIECFSVHDEGRRLEFFPLRIARLKREQAGIDLVIVRDWILNGALSDDPSRAVNYVTANVWEMMQNIGQRQAELMLKRQLAFFGTHDIVDHVGGSTREGTERFLPEVARIQAQLRGALWERAPREVDYQFSYLLAMVLDDLAQPRWYRTLTHPHFVERCLREWAQAVGDEPLAEGELPRLPEGIREIMASLRDQTQTTAMLDRLPLPRETPVFTPKRASELPALHTTAAPKA